MTHCFECVLPRHSFFCFSKIVTRFPKYPISSTLIALLTISSPFRLFLYYYNHEFAAYWVKKYLRFFSWLQQLYWHNALRQKETDNKKRTTPLRYSQPPSYFCHKRSTTNIPLPINAKKIMSGKKSLFPTLSHKNRNKLF